jgi:hypothetical protein
MKDRGLNRCFPQGLAVSASWQCSWQEKEVVVVEVLQDGSCGVARGVSPVRQDRAQQAAE